MASNQIQVTTSTLRNKQKELAALNKKFNNKLSSLDSSEREVTAMWEGDASKEFHKSYTADTAKMEELYKAVEQYCNALEDIIEQYEKTEKKNINIASKRTY